MPQAERSLATLIQLDLDYMSVHDLCDLLVVKTTEFLELIEDRHADGYKIRDLRIEVEKIQKAIKEQKMRVASLG